MYRNARARISGFVAVAAMAAAVAGCSSISESFGLSKNPPDEFSVVTTAPLVLPPDFTLRPPSPGQPRPQEPTPSQRAQAALTRSGVSTTDGGALPWETARQIAPVGASAGEIAFLRQAGALNPPTDIRQVMREELGERAEKEENFARRLIFWGEAVTDDPVIDPTAEDARLKANSAAGRPLTAGPTPVVQPQ